ncbi:ATP-binding protein [Variovorax sp. Sphag1AA]|uniref:ATP-binding protein n=1 Tax=Variovorax sp. Sphag1AA TaxID=2587027 RepID=UPI00162177A7|nr:ATP-binding protein [Variovorax sp. Sphag1AA]MBB3180959.1 hypothetical protein [Variovorax sp. Sphag1AA]
MQRTFREKTNEETTTAGFSTRDHRFLERNADLNWDQVLQSRRVLLVADAGAGKSYECERRAASMFDRGEAAFYLRLENLLADGVVGLLRRKQRQRFEAWAASSSQLGYFFLDSIDELQLVHGSFKEALYRLSEDLEGALGRAVIVVTSRPVPIDRQAIAEILPVPERPSKRMEAKAFVEVAMRSPRVNDGESPPETLKEISLLPLGDRQITDLAREHGVESPEDLLRQIHARNAHDFARWPQELIELCDDWREHGEIRPHFRQVESHVRARLTARDDRRERADLSLDKARKGAQRLALAVMLCRRWTFRYSAGADVPGSGDPPIDPAVLLEEWNTQEVRALLERSLFGEGGYGRARFRHRSVLEYLAACQINDLIELGALSLSAAMRMLFAVTDANDKVSKPSMRPVAAWLAQRRQDVFDAVLKVDPATLLLHGDPESLQSTQCQRALCAFVEMHGDGQWRGLEIPSVQVSRLARQPLGSAVLSLWQRGVENPEIRSLLLKLISEGGYQECADLAASVAANQAVSDNERFEALLALSKLSDDRLPGYVESAMSIAEGWPQVLGRWLGTYLYPEQVTDDQLLRLLGKVTRESRRDLDYAGSVARVIEKAELDVGRLKALLPGLIELTRKLLAVQEDDVAEPPGRLKASLILKATSARLLGRGVSTDDVLFAAVIAYRSAALAQADRSGNAELAKLIDELPSERRKRIFEMDYAWVAERYPDRTPRAVFVRLAFRDGLLTYSLKRDWDWAVKALGDAAAAEQFRLVLLYLVLYLAPIKKGRIVGRKAIERAVAKFPVLVAQLDESVAAVSRPNPEYIKIQKDQQQRQERSERKAARERKQWTELWRELAKKPTVALASDRRDSTIWNICLALRHKPNNHGEARWDLAFLRRHFGDVATDLFRRALMDYWRGLRPSVRRERKAGEKNTYLVVWSNALMGLYAEAQDPTWATKLSSAEAELAARYALLELNGLPSWLVALGTAHANVVERVLGEEIEEELSEATDSPNSSSILLQAVRYGRRETAQLVEQRLIRWLSNASPRASLSHTAEVESKLEQVTGVLLTHGADATKQWLAEVATRELGRVGDGPFQFFWLAVLCRADPHRGLVALLALLTRLPVEKNGKAVEMVGRLFDERSNSPVPNWRAKLSPEELVQLVKVVYHHVRPSHDIVHEGVYSPGSRDHAEDGRRYVFNELMAATGPGAMESKMALAADPGFAHLRDHIKQIARERLAAEIDASVFSPDDLVRMLRGGELTPKTGTDMAHLLLDRLDDLRDLMLQDTAPREAWARVNDENALRPAIAREFQVAARGAYTVDQEAVTVDGKETDIRLRALSDHQVTIELKVGEKSRSGKELRDTVEDQLVKKYMQFSKARTGCLIVTVSDPTKRWRHPDTGVRMDRAQLQEMLEEAAQLAQQRMGGDARVLARVLDLTPRLPTEANAAAQRKTRKKHRRGT